ncbi:ATP-binding protein [Streptomyces sp. NPDC058459]|uniref:ATP-binding protein n=1 Tax=Streptomyces sp. NPDC058459 TaxID=3346508 RepID=UPI0036574F26
MIVANTAGNTLYVASLHLTAVASAVPVGRAFVRQTLGHWNLHDHMDDAALVASELLTNAVEATGFPHPNHPAWQVSAEHVIAVQLRAVDDVLHVEVWDRSAKLPTMRTPAADAEGGRGLHLIEALAERWNVYRPPAGGKVVWAHLALTAPPAPPASVHLPFRRVRGATNPPSGPVAEQASTALMQRVLVGLRESLRPKKDAS